MNWLKKKAERQSELAVEEQQIFQQKANLPSEPATGKALVKHCLRVRRVHRKHCRPADYPGNYGVVIGRAQIKQIVPSGDAFRVFFSAITLKAN